MVIPLHKCDWTFQYKDDVFQMFTNEIEEFSDLEINSIGMIESKSDGDIEVNIKEHIWHIKLKPYTSYCIRTVELPIGINIFVQLDLIPSYENVA